MVVVVVVVEELVMAGDVGLLLSRIVPVIAMSQKVIIKVNVNVLVSNCRTRADNASGHWTKLLMTWVLGP